MNQSSATVGMQGFPGVLGVSRRGGGGAAVTGRAGGGG